MQSCKPYQAAIRWVMQNPNLDCVVPGMHSAQQMDELYEAIQSQYSQEDEQILSELKHAMIESDVAVQLRRDGHESHDKRSWD